MSEVTAVVLSMGEPGLARALASLERQTQPPAQIVRVENTSPFHVAFNQGVSRVRTPFFLQVDADMELDEDCLELLHAHMRPDLVCVSGYLRDPLIGIRMGIKLFRTEPLRQTPLKDCISCETEVLAELAELGWKTRRASRLDHPGELATFGNHGPEYGPAYTYLKYVREGSAYHYRGAWGGLKGHAQSLLQSSHPARDVAWLGLAQGLARMTRTDDLKAPGNESAPDPGPWTRARKTDWSLWLRAWTPQAAWAWGKTVGSRLRQRRQPFAPALRAWADSSHPFTWVACLGLAQGWLGVQTGRPDWASPKPVYLRPLAGRLKKPPWLDPLRRLKGAWREHKERCRLWLYSGLVAAARRARPTCPAVPARRASHPPVLGYYLWQYPRLSETFIRREVSQLRQLCQLVVLADECDPSGHLDALARAEIPQTQYLLPLDPIRFRRYMREFLRRQPLLCLRLLAWVLACPHQAYKSWQDDWRVLRTGVYLAGLAREHRLDLLHSPWGNGSAVVCQVASRLAGIPYSLQIRASELHRHDCQPLIPFLLPQAAAIVTNTRYNVQVLQGWGPRTIHRIPNGLDLASLPRLGRTHRAGPGPYRILSVGRLLDCKGFHLLLEACQLLRQRGVLFHCTIVGGEDPRYIDYRVGLRRLWRRLDLEGLVDFPGALPLPQILDLYRAADVFVLPALISPDGTRDIIPNVVLEAMAMELPVLTTPIGGVPEMLEHGVSGWLLEDPSPQRLAQELESLLHDPGRREQLGTRARQRIEEYFRVDRQAGQLHELFQRVVGGQPTPG